MIANLISLIVTVFLLSGGFFSASVANDSGNNTGFFSAVLSEQPQENIVTHHSHPTIMSLQGIVEGISKGDLGVKVSDQNSCVSGVFFDYNYSNAIQTGQFNLLLGSQQDLNLNYNQDYYLCLYVNGELIDGPQLFRGGQGQIGIEDINALGFATEFVPYTNATQDIDLGAHGFNAGDSNFTNIGVSQNTFLKNVNIAKDLNAQKVSAKNFVSSIATGTQPYACTSTTLNTNLNADLWDSKQFSSYLDQSVKTSDTVEFYGLNINGDGEIKIYNPDYEFPLTINRTLIEFDDDWSEIRMGSADSGYGYIFNSGRVGGSPGIALIGETWFAPSEDAVADPCSGIWANLKVGAQVQNALQTTGAAFTLFNDNENYTGQRSSALRVEDAVGESNTFALDAIGKVSIGGDLNVSTIALDGTGKVVCIKADGTLGTCSDAPNASGVCTCG